jgi:hypothetical protein
MQAVQQLTCPNCGNAIKQLSPTSQTVICSACNSYIGLGTGELDVIKTGTKLPFPVKPIALGNTATIQNIPCFVLGRVVYEGWDDEDHWQWTEWLLGAQDGRMFWLSYDDEDGFVFFKKNRIRAQFDPQTSTSIPLGDNSSAWVRERYPAMIVGAEGELTWRAAAGDTLTMVEAAAGGKRYSIQVTSQELELYEGVPLDEPLVAKAFGDEKWARRSERHQQNQFLFFFAGAASLVFACVGLVLGAAFWNSGNLVASETLRLDTTMPSALIPLDITNAGRPVMVDLKLQGTLPVNTYAEIDVNVIDPEDNESAVFSREFWHETGTDSDGSWEESDYAVTGKFVPASSGPHEIEVELSELAPGISGVTVKANVYKNHVHPTWFLGFGGLTAILGFGLLGLAHPEQAGNLIETLLDD